MLNKSGGTSKAQPRPNSWVTTGDGEILIEFDDKTITDRKGNDFDYSKDPEGKACPFQSHIRRANPRGTRDDIRTVPRIMRRGMSDGPPFDKNPECRTRLVFHGAQRVDR